MKILLFGAGGLVGKELVALYARTANEVNRPTSAEVDITKFEQVQDFVNEHKPELIINCAALTDVDKCELEEDTAYKINALGPKHIALAAREQHAKVIHLSTDYVFDGEKGEPYNEFDATQPINIYGKSKLDGEEFIKEVTDDFMIIRTAWVFGKGRGNFVDYVVDGVLKQKEITAIKDMVSSPTYAEDLAVQIKKMAETRETGIFHMANKGYGTRLEIVEEIMSLIGKPANVKVITQRQWEKPAKRPAFSALNNYHLTVLGKNEMPEWKEALKRYLKAKYKII